MIISNDSELRSLIPNVMSTVEGESSLYEKVKSYMGLVEASLSDIFIGPEMLANPQSMSEVLRNAALVYVANEAFRMAVPSLDLVLTPNGFGIVNNQNVVPALKERIERLMFSLAQLRDKAASTMLISFGRYRWICRDSSGEVVLRFIVPAVGRSSFRTGRSRETHVGRVSSGSESCRTPRK